MRVASLVVGMVMAGLCGLRALGDTLFLVTLLTFPTPDGYAVKRADLTAYVVGAVVWSVLAVVAAVLAAVVIRPGRSPRLSALAGLGIVALTVGYVLETALNQPTSM